MYDPFDCRPDRRFMKGASPFARVMAIIGMTIGGLVVAAAFALLFAIVIKALWNWLMPSIFGLKTIDFWQAFGLALLARLLFGGLGGNHRKSKPPRPRMDGHQSGQFKRYWNDEGYEAFKNYVKTHGDPADMPGEFFWGDMHRMGEFRRFWDAEGRDAYRDYVKRQEQQDTAAPEPPEK